MNKKFRKTKNNTSEKFHFKLIDWLFIVFGITVSIITLIEDHGHSTFYIVASVLALNCGIFETILGINGRRSSYIFAVFNSIACIIVAFVDQFYGNMAINVYYIPLSIAGFYSWGKNSDKNKNVIARRFNLKQIILLIAVFVVLAIGLWLILAFFDGHSIFLDSITTVLVVFSSVLMVLRYRENWLMWIISDALLLALFIGVNNPAVVMMRIFNVLTSVYGYINWRKLLKK